MATSSGSSRAAATRVNEAFGATNIGFMFHLIERRETLDDETLGALLDLASNVEEDDEYDEDEPTPGVLSGAQKARGAL